MLPLLERCLRRALQRPDLRLSGCVLRYFKWKPGTSAWLAYEAQTGAGEAAWVCGRIVPRGGARRGPDAGRGRPDVWAEEPPLALWLLPREPRLRGLEPAMRDRFVRRIIGAAHPALLSQGYRPARSVRLRIIRYKPLRRALVHAQARMRGRFPTLRRGLILRAYARRGQAEAVHRAALALVERGSSVARHLRLPRPLGCDPRRNVRWEEIVSGSPLADGLGGPEWMRGVRALGRGLAALHRLELPLPGRRDASEEMRRLLACLRGLEAWGPAFGGEARTLVRALAQRSFALDGWPLRPIHGDLHPAQILIRVGRRPGLLDLDELAQGDPLADLACWEAHLTLLALRGALTRETSATASAALRSAWRRAIAACGEDLSLWLDPARLRWQRAAALFRVAEAPLRDLRPGGAAATLDLVREARRALGGSAPLAPQRGRNILTAAPALRERLRDALDANEMGRAVEELLEREGGSTTLETIRARQIWPVSGRSWQVVYDLRLGGSHGQERSWACLRLSCHGEEAAPAADQPTFRLHRRTGGILSLFPNDRSLDRLRRIVDAHAARAAFRSARLPAGFAPPGRLLAVGVEPLSWRPELRASFRFRLRSAGGASALFGKAVPSRTRLERLQRALEAVRPFQGDAGAGGATVDHATISWLRLLLFPQRGGRSLFDLLAEAASAGTSAEGSLPRLQAPARQAGAAAARLHSAAPALEKRFDLGAELEVVSRWVKAAEVLHPAQAASLSAALEAVRPAAGKAAFAPPSDRLVHRDFYDRQILFDGEKTWIVDLDTVCLGDPALDLGNFRAHLVLRSLQHHRRSDAYETLSLAFVDGYGEAAPAGDSDLMERARFYEVTSLLRLAALYMFRPRSRSLFYPLLGQARRIAAHLQ
jgi:Ser/Thr protein kinase RdoA (MazF antagonist)